MRGLVIIWRYGKCGNCSIDASTKYFYKNNFVTFYQSYGKQQRNTLSHTSVLKLTYRWPISLTPPLIILTPAVKYFRLVACSMFYLLIGVWCRGPCLCSAPCRGLQTVARPGTGAGAGLNLDMEGHWSMQGTEDTEDRRRFSLLSHSWFGWAGGAERVQPQSIVPFYTPHYLLARHRAEVATMDNMTEQSRPRHYHRHTTDHRMTAPRH